MRMIAPLLAALAVLSLGTPLPATPLAAQSGQPPWLHASPLAGVVAASVPGDAPRLAIALQLETSRAMPIGLGITTGFAGRSAGSGVRELSGPWAEATLAYRFKLRFRGYLAPYAGPLLGFFLHDTGRDDAPAGRGEWLARWHFGGRAGLDIPVGRGWPAVRLDLAYRHTPSGGGLGGSDLTTALIGFRWSYPFP